MDLVVYYLQYNNRAIMASMNPVSMMANPVGTIMNNLPPFPLWLFKLLSTFPVTGILGVDHMAIGSPFTGFAKLFLNIFTLGSWYFYDILQVYNTENLRDKGLNIPFLEWGGIGAGRIDDTKSKELTKSSKSWLYLLITLLFGAAYYITTFFITKKTDTLSTALRFASSLFMFVFIGLALFTAFSFSSPSMNLFTIPTYQNPNQALSNLYTTTNMLPNRQSSSSVGRILSTPTGSMYGGSMYGGGNDKIELNDLRIAAASIMEGQDGGAKESKQSYDYIYLGTILLLLPIAGFISYTLRKKKMSKKNEVSNESN